MELPVFNIKGEEVGKIVVSDEFFSPPNHNVLWYYVKWFLAGLRQGTADTKTRAEVRGGGRKPWPQKHTGRARQGSIRAPHWRKGGVVFGPHPRDFSYKINKKEKREALRSSISFKFHEGKMKIVDKIEVDKTRYAREIIANLSTYPVCVVTADKNVYVEKAFSNIPYTMVKHSLNLNAYSVLQFDWLLIEKEALQRIFDMVGRR